MNMDVCIQWWSLWHALVSYEPLLKPFEVQLPYFAAKEGEQSDGAILEGMVQNALYWNNLLTSLRINMCKWKKTLQQLQKQEKKTVEKLKQMQRLVEQAQALPEDDKDSMMAQRVKLYDLRREFYALWDPLMKQTASLVVSVASYKAPFNFLYRSQRVEKIPAAKEFKDQLIQQLVQVIHYQRRLTQYFQEQKIPLSENWLKHYIQRKDILLRQGEKLENF